MNKFDLDKIAQAYKAYAGHNHKSNQCLWDLCCVAEQTVGKYQNGATREISEKLGTSADTVGNWARVGWLIAACEEFYTIDAQGNTWTLLDLWSTDKLSFDHMLKAAQAMKRYEISPELTLDRLLLAMDGGQSADGMAREIEVQEEDERVLWERDMYSLADAIQRQSDLFEYRKASPRLIRARNLLLGRIRQELPMSNIIEWIVEKKLAKNNFAAAHIANGLKLAGLDEAEQKRRVEQYRLWRRATKDAPVKCYEYVIAGKEPPKKLELVAADGGKGEG